MATRRRSMKGVEGVEAEVTVTAEGVDELSLHITSMENVIALRVLMNRALNTWDKAPKWAWELSSLLESKIEKGEGDGFTFTTPCS